MEVKEGQPPPGFQQHPPPGFQQQPPPVMSYGPPSSGGNYGPPPPGMSYGPPPSGGNYGPPPSGPTYGPPPSGPMYGPPPSGVMYGPPPGHFAPPPPPPGYYPPPGVAPPPAVGPQPQVVEILDHRNEQPVDNRPFFEKARIAIPVMPLWLAIICAILNIIPGVGTFVAGACTLCLPNYRNGKEKAGSFVINATVSALQFLTVFIFLFGLFWSLAWGVLFIVASREYRNSKQAALEAKSHAEAI